MIRLRVRWAAAGIYRRDNLGALWRENERLIRLIVKKITKLSFEDHAFDDAAQSAFFGILDAVDKFDPDRGTKFFSFAEYYMRLEIQRYHYSSAYNIRLPEHARNEVRRYIDTVAALKARDAPVTNASIRAEMQLGHKAYNTVLRALDAYKVLSLDMPITDGDGNEMVTLGDAIHGGVPADAWTIESTYRQALHEALTRSFRILSDIQEKTLRLVYFQGKDLSEAAQLLGCTRQAVFNNHRLALWRIRKSRYRQMLETFL